MDFQNVPLGSLSKDASVKPGTFRQEIEEDPWANKPVIQQEKMQKVLESDKDYIERFKLFEKIIGSKIKTVLYPACGVDENPAKAFSSSRVIHVDIDSGAIILFQKAGYEAYCLSILDFQPDAEIDVLILLNPYADTEKVAYLVKIGGYIICNNYLDTADEMKSLTDFSFLGVILPTNIEGQYCFDSQDLEKCWQVVETEEELQKAPFSFNYVSYDDAARIVEKFTEQRKNILIISHYGIKAKMTVLVGAHTRTKVSNHFLEKKVQLMIYLSFKELNKEEEK